MKVKEIDVLYQNVTVKINVPSSVEEAEQQVGELGCVLDGFISDTMYRNTLPRLYAEVAEGLEKEGYKRNETGDTRKLKDGSEKAILESDIVFIDRVRKEADEEGKAAIDAKIVEVANALPFYAARERSGGGKVSQGAMEAANGFFSEGPDRVEAVAAKIEGLVPGHTVARDASGAVTNESLARSIQALNQHLAQEAKKQAAAALA